MYANAQAQGGLPAGSSRFAGMWRSTDGGASWTNITAQANAGNQLDGCQCGYDQTIGVDPVDEDKVYIGFQELYYSDDGGATNFANISDTDIHWDHHALVFSPPNHRTAGDTTTRVWLGTDGGNSYTDDAGANFTHRNGEIATNLFRAMDIGRGSAANNEYSYGGAQDTGTMRHKPGDSGTEWHEAVNADGGRWRSTGRTRRTPSASPTASSSARPTAATAGCAPARPTSTAYRRHRRRRSIRTTETTSTCRRTAGR